MFIRPDEPDSPAVRVREFDGQYGGDDPEQLTAVIEVELGRDFGEESVAFHGQRSGCRVELGVLKIVGYPLQQANLIAGEEGEQVLEAHGEEGKNYIAAIGGADFTPRGTVQHQNVSRRKPLTKRSGEALPSASLGEYESESNLLMQPFFRWLEAHHPQGQIVLSKHCTPRFSGLCQVH
jgi:hypothetical protein